MRLFDRTIVLETFKSTSPKPALDELGSLYEDIIKELTQDTTIKKGDLKTLKTKAQEIVNELTSIRKEYEDKNYKVVVNKIAKIKGRSKDSLMETEGELALENKLFKAIKKTSFFEHLNLFKIKSNDAIASLAENINEAIYNQGGALLIYGAPLEDGTRRLYATLAKQLTHQNRVKMDSSAGIPNRNVTISNDVYRISMIDGRLKVNGVAWSSPDNMKKALGMNGNNVGLHYNKTPMHQETLQYNSIQKMLSNLHGSIVHLPNVRWQG